MSVIRLGLVGVSEGNSHPYAWAAICNGYDPAVMASCPFPYVPRNLSERRSPEQVLDLARVTHVWTQEREVSEHLAAAARIDTIVSDSTDLIGSVDAVLLARDDAENHLGMAKPFLEAGLPVYIDKPLAYTVAQASRILQLERYAGQVFSCSPMRYAPEFELHDECFEGPGQLRHVQANVRRNWERFAIHAVDPVLQLAAAGSSPDVVLPVTTAAVHTAHLAWPGGITASISALGDVSAAGSDGAVVAVRVFGSDGYVEQRVRNTVDAFERTLRAFCEGITTGTAMIQHDEMLAVIDVLERGAPVAAE